MATGAQLDFETKRTLRVTVEVTDGANALGDPDSDAIDDRQNVTITLTDVNEAPEVTGDASVSVAENLNRAVATYTGTDPERDTLTWSVNNNDILDLPAGPAPLCHAAQLRGWTKPQCDHHGRRRGRPVRTPCS